MRSRVREIALCALFPIALSGCPVTDDYFIDDHAGAGGSGAEAGTTLASMGGKDVKPQGGTEAAGSGTTAGTGAVVAAGGSNGEGGDAAVGMAGSADVPAGGAPPCAIGTEKPCPFACVPTTERCNGHDDNCNEVIDEQACNSNQNGTVGCSGFVLSSRPSHGYMLCTDTMRDYSHAQEACAGQGMRLAWLESAEENSQVATKVSSLSKDAEVYIGANDIANEGKWYWDGGAQFWDGNNFGKPVNGMYSAWTQGTPNNANNSEDCAVLSSGSATWGDRSCSIKFAYLCEEAEP
jgi:hypothetical protein